MSYPFGSGMPPLPNQTTQSNPSYPNQSQPPYPTQSYPSQMHSYPSQSQPHAPFGAGFIPPNANASAPAPSSTTAYPPIPNASHTQSHYPSYPPMQQNPYPSTPSTPSYPPMHQNPSTAPSYPRQAATTSSYPTQSAPQYGAPPHNPNSHVLPPHQGYSGYGFQQISSSGGPSYPNVNSMVPSFSQMQGHIKDGRRSKGNPTVVPAQNFDPVADATALRKAMKGFGTDEDALIDIICGRSNEQRQIIQRTYKSHFGKDLIEDIRSETSGNFENLLVALLTPIVDFYVKELHDAMEGIGTDEDVLIEVLCSMSNYEINTIKHAYERLYGKSLETELMSETSGNFKRLLVSLCAGNRDESGLVDHDAASRDATELLRAGELRAGTDESTFNMVFCQRNFAQLKLICDKYQAMTGHSLRKAIENEFSGDIKDGLIAILQCTTNKAEFFAERLHKSMAGIGTNDRQLIRVIVTRCEVDLNDIKAAYERLFSKSLRSWIKGDTSGHYKHCLYKLIGENRS